MTDGIRIRTWTCSCDVAECVLNSEAPVKPHGCPLGKRGEWTEARELWS